MYGADGWYGWRDGAVERRRARAVRCWWVKPGSRRASRALAQAWVELSGGRESGFSRAALTLDL